MPARRVVITGLAPICPLGLTKDDLWVALKQGRSGIARLESLPAEALPAPFGGESRQFTGHIDDFGELEKEAKRAIRKGIKVMCREIQMGVAAAQRAIRDAGLLPDSIDPERTGVVYGSDHILTTPDEFAEGVRNCLDEHHEFQFSRWAEDGMPKVTPLWLLKYLPNMPASHIAIYNDFRGPNNSITLREASGNLAIAEAYCAIVRGSADAIVAGATGTRVHPLRTVHTMLQEEIATNGIDPTKACRPFDKDRTGMVIGEGAGAIVLELLEHAQNRGATIFGEVVGYGSSTVMTKDGTPQPDVAFKNVLNVSLHSANLTPDEIGHIHAHGLSTIAGDLAESQGINEVFAGRRNPIPVVAAKSNTGNLGAGSGLVEAIASTLALHHGELFPAINYQTPDPDCDLHVVQEGNETAGKCFINVSISPQAQASAVVIRKWE